jgi:hypothetical protein
MLLVFDPSDHVYAAALAGMALDDGVFINDLQFFTPGAYLDFYPRHDGNLRKESTFGFPAFGTTAYMIVCRLAADTDLDRIILAVTSESATTEPGTSRHESVVDRWMYGYEAVHGNPPVSEQSRVKPQCW